MWVVKVFSVDGLEVERKQFSNKTDAEKFADWWHRAPQWYRIDISLEPVVVFGQVINPQPLS